MFAPYPKVEVAGDVLIGYVVAMKNLLGELDRTCDDEVCDCASARRIKHARTVLAAVEGLVEAAEMKSRLDFYMRHVVGYVDETHAPGR